MPIVDCQPCRQLFIGDYSPISCANVASVVCWDASTDDDDPEEHEAGTGGNLDHTDNELDLFQLAQCSGPEAIL